MSEQTYNSMGGSGSGKSIDLRHREASLLELAKALRAISIYPPRHPQRANIVGQAYGNVQVALQMLGDMAFGVTRGYFTHGEHKLGESQQMIRELAHEIHLRQIRSFSLRADLSLDDFTVFLELLLQDPEEFRKGKYIERWLGARGVRTLWVNEIDFSKMVTAAGEAEDGEEEMDDSCAPADSHALEALELLDAENDPEKVGQLLREIEVLARPLIDAGEYQPAWYITAHVSFHATEERRPGEKGEQIRAMALRTVKALAREKFLTDLLRRYADPGEQQKPPLRRALRQVERPALEAAADLLADREAMTAYKPLMDFMIELGPAARPVIESQLKEDDPVRLRKMLFILGEIKDRKSVEAIKPCLYSEDKKARREAIRALSKIRGMEASRALVGALQKEKEIDSRTFIVQSLGESKDLAAVPVLINSLRKTPLREDTLPLMEEVIKALGAIGSREAVPHLIKVLNRWTLFGKELNQALRIRAAEALGALGGESAMQALARYAGKDDDPFRKKCTEVLETLLQVDGNPTGGF